MPFAPIQIPFPVAAVVAKNPSDFAAVRTTTPPKIDGEIGLEEWPDTIRRNRFVTEDTGAETDQKAEFWLTYDKDAIYFAGRLKADPSKILAVEHRQNVSVQSNDHFVLVIDPLGDGTNFNAFRINPRGATQIQLAGGRAAKTEWLGEFEAKGRVTETGWEFEARIPWAIMSLAPAARRDLRFNVAYYSPQFNRSFIHHFAQNSRDFPLWRQVETPEPASNRSIKLLPYGYLGIDDNKNHITNVGLDIKTALSDKVQAVATVNPDFRNIENDILSLDFSYFARLGGENRPFFQEGSEYRAVGSRLFASQKIEGIDFGFNTYGALSNSAQFNAIGVVDFGKKRAIQTSFQKQLDAKNNLSLSYVGLSEPGVDNHVGVLNFGHRSGSYEFYAGHRQSEDTIDKSGMMSNVGVFYGHKAFRGGVEAEVASASFMPRAGFLTERDYRNYSGWMDWNRQYKKGPIQSIGHNAFLMTATRNDGSFYKNETGIFNRLELRNGVTVGAFIARSSFLGSNDQQFNYFINFPNNNPYTNLNFGQTYARFSDQMFRSTDIGVNYRLRPQMQLNLSSQFVEFNGSQTQQIASLRMDRGKYESYGLKFVRRDNDINFTASYRLSGKRGPEYFIVLGDPNAQKFQKQLVIKAVVPIEIKY